MAELTNVKELLNTGLGTEGSLLIEKKIYDTVVEEVEKSLIPRELAALYLGPAQILGSSIDINRETPNTGDVREIAEGADIPMDNAEYSSINLKPKKYGVLLRITRELMEDSKFPILERQLRLFAKRMAESENSMVIAALDNAANTVAGGAAITIANITRAMQYLEDADYTPTDFVVGNEVLNDLRNIDTFVEFEKSGSLDMLERGFRGVIYGMKVHRVSTNAGMTASTSYVIDRSQAYVIAEKRTLTVENFEVPTHDMSAAALTQRMDVSALRTDAIAKITTS